MKVAPLLQLQLKAPHSLLIEHESPGCFGPTGPASGGVTGVPAHPPWVPHAEPHCAVGVLHAPPEQGDGTTGFFPSLHAQMIGSQSPESLHFQPPSLAHAFGHAASPDGEQRPLKHAGYVFEPKPWLHAHSTLGCDVIFPH